MFESSLIDLGDKAKKVQSRRWLSLPVAVGLHLGLAATIAFAAYWNIAEVTEPEVNVVFFAQKELPPPGPAAPPAGEPERTPAQAPPTRVVEPEQPVQPEDVPDEMPPADATPVPVPAFTGPATGTGDPSGPVGPGGPGFGPDSGCVGPLCGDGPSSPVPVVAPPPSDAPLPVGGAVTKPEAVYKVKPGYTEGARRIRLSGVVIVQAVIDEQGRVIDVQLVKGLPMGLDRSAVDAVKQWRFTPATRYGRPVKAYFNLTVRFEVQ